MRAVIQRVVWAKVRVQDHVVGSIGCGLAILLGVQRGDTSEHAHKLANKIAHMRIFSDDQQKMNRSLLETQGQALVVSQFTLCADLRKGRRPYFGDAESPERAATMCEEFCSVLKTKGIQTETGTFGAMMRVELCNDGPVTLVVDTDSL